MNRIQLQFSTTPVSASGVIRILTRSDYSHVDVVIPPGLPSLEALTPQPYGLLGASDPGGVMIRPPNYHEFKTRHRLTLESDRVDKFLELAASQIGKPFDNDALHRVFDPNWRVWTDNGKWYCAELVLWALDGADFWDRKHPITIDLNHVTPNDILLLLAGEYDPVEFSKEYTDD